MASLPSSLQRILELFEKLGVSELDVNTVARHLEVKRSTAKKYLDQLAKLGYLEKKMTGIYALKGAEKEEPRKEAGEAKAGEQAPTVEAKPAEQGQEEAIKSEALEVKPTGEVVETFYFYYKGGAVHLRVTNLEQLAAVLRYKLVSPEELAYSVRTGFLQTWIERVLHDTDLAKKLDELRGLSDQELFNEAVKIVTQRANVC